MMKKGQGAPKLESTKTMNAIANKIYTEDEPEQFAAALKLLPNIGPFKTDASNKPKPMTQQNGVAGSCKSWLAACEKKFANMNLPTRKDLFGDNGFDTKKALAVAYAEYYAKIRDVYGEIGAEVDKNPEAEKEDAATLEKSA